MFYSFSDEKGLIAAFDWKLSFFFNLHIYLIISLAGVGGGNQQIYDMSEIFRPSAGKFLITTDCNLSAVLF